MIFFSNPFGGKPTLTQAPQSEDAGIFNTLDDPASPRNDLRSGQPVDPPAQRAPSFPPGDPGLNLPAPNVAPNAEPELVLPIPGAEEMPQPLAEPIPAPAVEPDPAPTVESVPAEQAELPSTNESPLPWSGRATGS